MPEICGIGFHNCASSIALLFRKVRIFCFKAEFWTHYRANHREWNTSGIPRGANSQGSRPMPRELRGVTLHSGQDLTVGIGGYYGRQNYGFGRNVDGWAGTTDLTIPLGRYFGLSAEFYRGRAVGGLGGGIGQRVLISGDPADPSTTVRGLDSMGGWVQLKFKPWKFRGEWGGWAGQSVCKRTEALSDKFLLLRSPAVEEFEPVREFHLPAAIRCAFLGRISSLADDRARHQLSDREPRECQPGICILMPSIRREKLLGTLGTATSASSRCGYRLVQRPSSHRMRP